jgi:hypothetical protein
MNDLLGSVAIRSLQTIDLHLCLRIRTKSCPREDLEPRADVRGLRRAGPQVMPFDCPAAGASILIPVPATSLVSRRPSEALRTEA